MDNNVEITLDPHRRVRQVKKSFVLTAKDEEDILLPVHLTELVRDETDDPDVVRAVRIPLWLAEDRGLVEPAFTSEPNDELAPHKMSRGDWFLLGLTMAMLIRGHPVENAVWDAQKVLDKMRLSYYVR